MSSKFLTFSITFLTLLHNMHSKILRGTLVTRENWAFLARFCFLTEQGTFRYDLEIRGEYASVNLLLYYDAPHQWPTVYPSNKTCKEKESILSIANGQIVRLSALSSASSGCVLKNDSSLHCNSYRRFQSSRPMWWFIVLSDCYTKTGLNVTYWISLTNASPGNIWKEHLSADEFYILPELLIAACIYVVLVILSFYVAVQLRSRRLLHVSYKLFMGSLLCQLIGILLEIYSYLNLALRGVPITGASLVGHLLEACSETLYTVLMLLLAFGYTITKSTLTPKQIRWLTYFICLSAACQLALYVYQFEIFDPGLILYIYESPPGYGLVALKLIAWIIFVLRCFKTTKKMTKKVHFYASLLSLGSAWFLCHPLTVLCITVLVDKWIRESVVRGCFLWIVLVGHATFLYVTRPTIANSRFPFHIRTCQVVPVDGNGQNHSYEPRFRKVVSAFTIS
ncbi:transmembrane protein 145-like [Polistes fuscatus]|uniref:transmembrane protein 145-like n=1 Tax=Polistes fuscatus TaxID=30207 RepID=UPI001CA9AB3F|nr:transmembrane protein 145-like [Polistes fuscatus]